jgi:site-specific recombinase XerD
MTTPNEATLRSYTRSLKYQNRSQRTIDSYMETARQLSDFNRNQNFEDMTRDDIESYLLAYAASHTPGGVAVRFRSLRALFGWMESEEIVERSPMARMKQPFVPEVPIEVLTSAQLTRLLNVTEGKGFEQKRDRAILLVCLDAGLRVGELCGITMVDLDMDQDLVYVTGKGRRPRSAPLGHNAGQSLDRYLRERARHPAASKIDGLWIGSRNMAMTPSGISQMLRRRGAEAGVPDLHPHKLRHTWAHLMKVNGIDEDSLMRLGGWKSRSMVSRYGASAGDQRAREAHRQFSPGDRL